MSLYYEDEYVRLFHGDCREELAWLDADVLVTDPPYGVAWTSGQFSRAKKPIVQDVAGDADTSIRDAAMHLWGPKPALIFGSWRANRPPNIANRLIWYKAANKPGMRTQPWYAADEEIYQIGTGFTGSPEHNVLITHDQRDGAHGEVARLGHPTPKPVGLMERLVAKCPPGLVGGDADRGPQLGPESDRRGGRGTVLRAHRVPSLAAGFRFHSTGGRGMTNTNKARGTRLERLIADYLAERLGDDRIDRLPLRGVNDRGDIGGVRTLLGEKVAVECKSVARLDLAGWVTEAQIEAGNADAPVGIVIHRRKGKGQPGDQYVTLTVDGLIVLLGGPTDHTDGSRA